MNGSPAGFRGAPLTRGIVLATLSSSIILQASSGARRRIPLASGFSHVFCFRHPGELLFGAMLTYYFRVFERQLGTGKYGAFIVTTSSIAYVLQTLLTNIFNRPSASGLHPIIFANLVPFMLDIPALHKFSLFGFRMNDKAFIYLAAVQLLLSSSQRSVAAGLCGMIAGLVYRSNVLGMQSWRLPRAVENVITAAFGRSHPVQHPARGMQQQQQPATQPLGQPPISGGVGRRGGGGGVGAPAPEPSPEALAQLESMGFDRDRAAHALQASGNNLERAVQALVG